MVPQVTPRLSAVLGLILLTGWLGWSVAAFSHWWTPAAIERSGLEPLLQQLRRAHPVLASGQPLAILLDPCPCTDAKAWQQLGAQLLAVNGAAHQLPAPPQAAGIELLVLAADGQPVYAGPIQPQLPFCGIAASSPAAWLPGLLDGSQPPLFLTSACSCR